MRALFITALILLLLLLILQVRLRLLFQCEGTSIQLKLLWGPLRLTLYPMRPPKSGKKEKRPKQAKPEQDKPARKTEKRQLPAMTLDLLRELFSLLADLSGRMKRKLRIDELTLRLYWGLEDPADAAISYGLAQAALGALLAFVEVHFTVKKRQTEILLDYSLEKPHIVSRLLLSITVWQLMALGLRALWRVFRIYRAQKSSQVKTSNTNIKKAVYDNGKESSHQ